VTVVIPISFTLEDQKLVSHTALLRITLCPVNNKSWCTLLPKESDDTEVKTEEGK
jgi:hypothetical protein